MGTWLQRILLPATKEETSGSFPAQRKQTGLPAQPLKPVLPRDPGLPNATIIYGIGGSLLFVASFSLLLTGRVFSGIMVFVLGGCLVGFAVHLLKHQD
jgi:hypothetical protein